jgi:hypothetical protein
MWPSDYGTQEAGGEEYQRIKGKRWAAKIIKSLLYKKKVMKVGKGLAFIINFRYNTVP